MSVAKTTDSVPPTKYKCVFKATLINSCIHYAEVSVSNYGKYGERNFQ